ncbi:MULTISPECIES: CAP-associated domain-containing protein [Staphylococcus]|jgi:uncharacterized protein YkwD|uniref:Allergen V5/Tpx-1 related protein n=1 Tax=Staphylococcus nepalensis TaxID=214473 RepID=A0A291JM30_9STAP|nr:MULTISPECIES: CAP-associated domain-containing protein [Staphylococcus]VDG67495.1 uncharacterized protein, YkwD family [Lacrimispora indolis]ATH60488.1 SCP-like extracellular protein [Staphylococcus nepalensis]ATH65534.1 SCP-like extracellular protein [Staphylococcus nepalensis]AWI44906.1 SCP-like extracellular protein [Staphylococcus nepalensis]MBO1204631.1 SCP-like extracellular protein [Staphylococcus nepalensis]
MKKLIIKVIGVLLLICFIIYLFYSPRLKFDVLENPNKDTPKTTQNKDFQKQKTTSENPKLEKGVGTWVGQDLHSLTDKYGQADRVYSYKKGFKNYVFKQKDQYYLVTTRKNKIKSVYATGKNASVNPVEIGDKASNVFEKFSINPEPTIKVDGKAYELELSDADMKTQTLIKFNDVYAQIYIDQQDNEIVGVRYLDSEALMAFKPYQMITAKEDKKVKNNYKEIPYEQNANQLMTLYEITNEMRALKDAKTLKVNNDLAHIASYNLYEAIDTDSVEFTEEALKQKLDEQNISFVSTSQNVGYDFNEVPTLIHSWLNSDIHRSRMLNSKYNEMGGEVSNGYYTIIFIEDK